MPHKLAFLCVESGRACVVDAHDWPESPGFANVLLIKPKDLEAYAAGIRAAVLAEVRAVVPEPARGRNPVSDMAAGVWNSCRDDFLAALTTLEQQP